eukprot:10856641-Prorocentrum_lima.AAC.1
MTSSLVGSEMCIRDSLLLSCWHRPWRQAAQDLSRIGRIGTAHSKGEAPVSYTHLTLPTICSV